eukprot:m.95624 g.95624  ORF g.95624 m.95624 type:complete len:555 (-) comp13504_c0_seq3:131-1795(-)
MDNPWWWGNIKREPVEDHLRQNGKNGFFLCRNSGTVQNQEAFVISCIYNQEITHHLLMPERVGGNNYYLLNECRMSEPCDNMEDVIRYLQTKHPSDIYPWTTPLTCYLRKRDREVVQLPPVTHRDGIDLWQMSKEDLITKVQELQRQLQQVEKNHDNCSCLEVLTPVLCEDCYVKLHTTPCHIHTYDRIKSWRNPKPPTPPPQPIPPSPSTETQPEEHGGYDPNEWRIQWEALKVGKLIGEGSYGKVYKGEYYGNVAIKKLKVDNPSPEDLEAFENEVMAMRRTRHQNVLLYCGACFEVPNLAIVTVWCSGQSLYSCIHTSEDWGLRMIADNGLWCLNMLTQTIDGMQYLHSKKIIHRDLKSNNILLSGSAFDPNTRAQIADFGLAMMKSHMRKQKGPAGSIIWMSPEIITIKKGENPYTNLSDVYAFGIVMFEVFAGQLPYKGKVMEQIVFLVGRGLLKPDFSQLKKVPAIKAIQKIIEQCVATKPADRPDFTLLRSKFDDLIKKTPVVSEKKAPRIKKTQSLKPGRRLPDPTSASFGSHSAHSDTKFFESET